MSTPTGVKAGVGYEDAHGYKIKYVVVDAGSSPTGALSAAQRLVEQDHVFAVIAVSGVTFAAAPYLLANGIPVIGSASDASEWITDRNMFSVFGTADYSKVESTDGLLFKLLGAKNIGSLGYSIVAQLERDGRGGSRLGRGSRPQGRVRRRRVSLRRHQRRTDRPGHEGRRHRRRHRCRRGEHRASPWSPPCARTGSR